MKSWRNPDLLVAPARRRQLEAEFPGMIAVFDWKELRDRFEEEDPVALGSRARRRQMGVAAVSVAALGALLAALLPLVEISGGTVANRMFGASAVLSVVGFLWALLLQLIDRDKDRWLEHRLRTERIRQFYFQFMLSDPALAARALGDAAALGEWRTRRAQAFEILEGWLEEPTEAQLRAVLADVNLKLVWQATAWKTAGPLPAADDHAVTYFEILRRQRIESQLDYIREKLSGWTSPENQLSTVTIASWVLAVAAILVPVVTAVELNMGESIDSPTFRILTCGTAAIGLVAIYLRVLAEGLGLRADVGRYRWYRDAVEKIEADFHDPSPAARLGALRDLESLSYREMREFLESHDRSSFNFS